MARETVRVKGIKQLERALRQAEDDSHRLLQDALKEAADIVRQEAFTRFVRVSPRSAAGFRPRVRTGRAFVEQRLRRTTGEHPGFGSMQLAVALIPALENREGAIVERLERALDEVARGFN